MPNLNGRLHTATAIMMFMSTSAFAAGVSNNGLCNLIRELHGVFQTLRILAFVGAGFMLAKYGWEMIEKGKIGGKDNLAEGLKAIGVPLIVGITLLFSIGLILGFLMDGRIGDCADILTTW